MTDSCALYKMLLAVFFYPRPEEVRQEVMSRGKNSINLSQACGPHTQARATCKLFSIVSHWAFCISSLGGLLNIQERIPDFEKFNLTLAL